MFDGVTLGLDEAVWLGLPDGDVEAVALGEADTVCDGDADADSGLADAVALGEPEGDALAVLLGLADGLAATVTKSPSRDISSSFKFNVMFLTKNATSRS